MATLQQAKALLNDQDTEVCVLTFPKGHCWSSATGFLKSPDGRGVFVKDRDEDEALLQETISFAGKEFCKPFPSVGRVAPNCYSIDRPSLNDYKEKSPGHKLWKLKEEQWKRDDDRVTALRLRKQGGPIVAEDDDEMSIEDERKSPPSEYDCWQLEEAAIYSLGNADEIDAKDASVDQSLRRKLRLAAGRSGTKCLDFATTLLMTEYAQAMISTNPDWKDCKGYLLRNQEDALSAAETYCLLTEKLTGAQFELAALFSAAIALPDVNIENLALEEFEDGKSYGVRLLHFDTGVVPAKAGVSLEKLKPVYEDICPWDFTGRRSCKGYYLPCTLMLPALNQPLSSETLNGLQKIDSVAVERLLSGRLSDPQIFAKGLGDLGGIVKQRIDRMQVYATANPSRSLRDLMFHTVSAWQRDFPEWLEKCETPGLIESTLEWAEER